jgi:hypothetical protein
MALIPSLAAPLDPYFSPHSTGLPFGISIGYAMCIATMSFVDPSKQDMLMCHVWPFGSTLTNTSSIKGTPTPLCPAHISLNMANQVSTSTTPLPND